tara:strand:+ start:1067 stop:1507 length:441 start_codon:yes stop_codon:yes gene_type:complete
MLSDTHISRVEEPEASAPEPFTQLAHDDLIEVVERQQPRDVLTQEPGRAESVNGIHCPWPAIAVIISTQPPTSRRECLTRIRRPQQIARLTSHSRHSVKVSDIALHHWTQASRAQCGTGISVPFHQRSMRKASALQTERSPTSSSE